MGRAAGLIVLGAVAATLLLELLFRILPVSTSTAMDYYADEHILSYEPHHRFVAASGWDLEHSHTLRANNAGFVAARDFAADPNAIALIGDSFVEASMLTTDDKLDTQITRALPRPRPVYALGAPGSSLLDYAERVRFAATQYQVHDFVIIVEEGDVLQAICGSGQVHGRCYDEQHGVVVPFRQASAGTLKRILRHSALAQYLTSQLKIDLGQALDPRRALELTLPKTAAADSSAGAQPAVDRSRALEGVADAFFAAVAPYRNGGQLILVLEDRTVSGMERNELQRAGREMLVARARAAGAVVIDTGPVFRDFVERTGRSIAVSPRDHHWNRAATGLVAECVAQTLR